MAFRKRRRHRPAKGEQRPQWGLIKDHRSLAVLMERREADCSRLGPCETRFAIIYGTLQGRCPEDCGGYTTAPIDDGEEEGP